MDITRTNLPDGWADRIGFGAPMLSPDRERGLLAELDEIRRRLAEAVDRVPQLETVEGADDSAMMGRFLVAVRARRNLALAPLEADLERYFALRTEVALANMRLVAHVAKRYRDRGIAYADLIQEGFCGLLEAIDRFDVSRETKLSTYATWWIRQAVQRALAAGAYPVRLSPRHLRQLAQSEEEKGAASAPAGCAPGATAETIQRIQAATRPAISLDAPLGHDPASDHPLALAMADDGTHRADLDGWIEELMQSLRPRDRQVLSLRFGLGDQPRLSLSQVGQVLEVSKERVRQIQDRALALLRTLAESDDPPALD